MKWPLLQLQSRGNEHLVPSAPLVQKLVGESELQVLEQIRLVPSAGRPRAALHMVFVVFGDATGSLASPTDGGE